MGNQPGDYIDGNFILPQRERQEARNEQKRQKNKINKPHILYCKPEQVTKLEGNSSYLVTNETENKRKRGKIRKEASITIHAHLTEHTRIIKKHTEIDTNTYASSTVKPFKLTT